MAQSGTARRTGHARQRSATAKVTAAKPRRPRGSANGSSTKAGTKSAAKPTQAKSAVKQAANKAAVKPTSPQARKPPVKKAATKAAVKRTASKVADAVTPDTPPVRGIARRLAKRAVRKLGERVLDGAGENVRGMGERVAALAAQGIERPAERRLPIQCSLDIAVPVRVAWEEWMALEFLPEGVHTVTDIERDGDDLDGHPVKGRSSTPTHAHWAGEVLDEREEQSFAWRSRTGGDCAGLITFHELSERLTRVELNLDVVPTRVLESLKLVARLADRRAEADLRRFKARLELISPDLYEDTDTAARDGSHQDEEGAQPADAELQPNDPDDDPQPDAH